MDTELTGNIKYLYRDALLLCNCHNGCNMICNVPTTISGITVIVFYSFVIM